MGARVLWLGLASAALAGCGASAGPAGMDPSAEANADLAETVSGPVDLTLGPVSTFESACARCHGPEGAFYGQAFADLGPSELRKEVREMMEGPGELHPSTAEVLAMVAYHRAIRREEPFVCIQNGAALTAGDAETIRGEASLEAEVVVEAGDSTTRAERDGPAWTVADPPAPPFEVRVEKGGRAVRFTFPARQWSAADGE